MPTMRILVVISISIAVVSLLFGSAALALQDPAPPSTAPASAPASRPGSGSQPAGAITGKPQRVVLRVNRNTDVKGYLELEDDEVVVIRDLHGNRQSFAKARVQIVRLTEPQPEQTGIVRMIDGQIRRGIIIDDGFNEVIVEIEGIRANLKRETVDYVELAPTVEELYAEYKKSLDPTNHDAHLTLCRWLFEKRRYELAKDETLALLEKVEMPEARSLLNLINAQLALKVKPAPAPEAEGAGDGEAAETPRPETDSGPVRLADVLPDQIISTEDVNLIRVYEIDFDHAPRVTITPDAVRTLIEKYGTNSLIPANQTGRNALFRTAADDPLQIVRLMFELRARDLYGQVQVNSEPYALNLFRRRVHDTWLINTCATNACHGGLTAGSFFLHRRDYKDERVRFTNMLILERLKLDPDWPLINFERPEDSLIIQYALPRDLARKPHPRVDGWKAAFSPANTRLKEEAIEWINSMMPPRPEYPVEFEPPVLDAARREAGANSKEPTSRVPR